MILVLIDTILRRMTSYIWFLHILNLNTSFKNLVYFYIFTNSEGLGLDIHADRPAMGHYFAV